MGRGSERLRSSIVSTTSSMSPVGMLGFLRDSSRSWMVPVAVMTNSSRRASANLKAAAASGFMTSWMIPVWSRRSTKMRPPWSRRELTQPETVEG